MLPFPVRCSGAFVDLLCFSTTWPSGRDNSRDWKPTQWITVRPVSMGVIGCVISLYSWQPWQLTVPLVSASMRLRRICVRCHIVKRLCPLHGLYSVTRENPRAEHSGLCCDVIYTLGNLKQHCCEFETSLLYSSFYVSLSYIKRPCLQRNQKHKNQPNHKTKGECLGHIHNPSTQGVTAESLSQKTRWNQTTR